MSTVAKPSTAGTPGVSQKKRTRDLAARTVERRAPDGTVLGTVDLDSEWFGHEPNGPLMHQVVVAQLAAARSGTQSTRTRAEVAGGGAKPFRQKGMGRARQGSIRAPQWVGGGVALGPKPRSYKQRTPKKMIRLALCSALSDRAALERVALVDHWDFEIPKTKEADAVLASLGLEGRVLIVLGADDVVAERSFGNLPRVEIVQVGELNTYDVLRSDWILFTDDSLPGGVGDVSSHEPHPERAPASTAGSTRVTSARAKEATATAEDSEAAEGTEAAQHADAAEAVEDEGVSAHSESGDTEAEDTESAEDTDEVEVTDAGESTRASGTEASET